MLLCNKWFLLLPLDRWNRIEYYLSECVIWLQQTSTQVHYLTLWKRFCAHNPFFYLAITSVQVIFFVIFIVLLHDSNSCCIFYWKSAQVMAVAIASKRLNFLQLPLEIATRTFPLSIVNNSLRIPYLLRFITIYKVKFYKWRIIHYIV
jgi:hypothetical protein